MRTLVAAGVAENAVRVEVASGAGKRPELERLVAELECGDHLVVARLDRLGRSVGQLSALVHDLHTRGVLVVSCLDGLRSDTVGGRLLLHVLSAAAQYERELLSERTRGALAEAKRRGVHVGRPRRLGDVEMRAIIAQLEEGATVAELARSYHCSARTLWYELERVGWQRGAADAG